MTRILQIFTAFLLLGSVLLPLDARRSSVRAQDALPTGGFEGTLSVPERFETPVRQPPPRETVALDVTVDPDTYRLGPSDEVTVGIWDEIARSIPQVISPEGTAILSPAGPVGLAGLTIREAGDRVREVLGTYYPDAKITLTLTGIRTIKVHLSGEVYYPGSYEVTPIDRLYDLVQLAGGFLPGGSVRSIRIHNADGSDIERTVDLERFLQAGEIDANPRLREGDIVHVPPKTNVVLVRGEVHGRVSPGLLQQRPAATPEEEVRGAKTEIFLEFREGDMLSGAIMRAGGLRETADMTGAYIRRHEEASGDTILPVDLHRLFVLGDTSADVALRKGDIVEVPMEIRSVYVIGIVNAPGPIPYQAGRSAYQYVGMAGGPTISGSSSGWKVVSVDGRRRKIHPNDVVNPGETVVVPERMLSKIGRVLTPISAASTIIISIVAVQRR